MKNQRWLFLKLMVLLAGTFVYPLKAQQIIWEKVWGFSIFPDEIYKVVGTGNGQVLTLGLSQKFWNQVGDNFFSSPVLQKINQNGDTLFLRRLGNVPVSGIAYLGHKFGNIYQAVIQSPINDNNLPVSYPCILEFTDEGQLLETRYLTGWPEYRPNSCVKTPDGGLILAGYYNGALSAPTNMMAIKVNFLNEVEWSYQYPPPVQIPGYGNRLEKMANGNYLLSGTLGRRIYGFEIDSNGQQVGQKTFYETPSSRVFSRGGAMQAWGKSSMSFGNYQDGSNQFWGYFGSYDSLGNRLWGGESIGTSILNLIINKENSFLIGRNSGGIQISRIRRDSTVLWNWYLGGINQPYRFMNGLCFLEPDSGLVFGFYSQQTGNLNNQFWIAKIAGVGTAYDPTNPDDTVNVSVEERMFRPKDAPVLYPNPATETLRFQKLTGATRVGIYSIQGQKVREYRIEPEQPLDICDLPPGAYLYHLNMGERVFTGKFWKR